MAPRRGTSKSTPSQKSKKTKKKWTHVHLYIFCLGVSGFLTIILGCLFYLLTSLHLPDVATVVNYRPPAPTTILAGDGTVIDRVYQKKSFPIELTDMPPLMVEAFIATEDARFKDHRGIDVLAILRAFLHNLRANSQEEGGSTITQQTARMLLLNREKSYIRKIKEAILAIRIEQILSKEEIIQLYLNRIYLGEGAYGVEAAARTYFDKHAGELNLPEIAILAGLPQAPSAYSPFNNFSFAKKRQAYVLNRMSEEGYITSSQAEKAYVHKLLWSSRRQKDKLEKQDESGYFLQYILNHIKSKYGKDILSSGLIIHTTLDPDLQKKAITSVRKGISRWRQRHPESTSRFPQAALVAIEIGTGKIKAMVGGRNFSESQFNRVTQARRQPGSAFKPFIYAVALENGFDLISTINDEPLTVPIGRLGKTWEPRNFSGEYFGPTTLYNGIVNSRNIVSVKLLQKTGLAKVKRLAINSGISTPLANSPTLALGTSEVTLLELTSAYTTFANQGILIPPTFIERIEDNQGNILIENKLEAREVLSRETAFQMNYLLQAVISEGTGKLAWGLQSDSAGKTGTTDNLRDGWFIGYTPILAAGVWMGFDKGNSLGKRETGGRICAPVWLDFMKKVEDGKHKFPVPEGIVFLPFDRETGKFQPDNDKKSDWLPFKKGKLPEMINSDYLASQ